jgi:hypothetical protein
LRTHRARRTHARRRRLRSRRRWRCDHAEILLRFHRIARIGHPYHRVVVPRVHGRPGIGAVFAKVLRALNPVRRVPAGAVLNVMVPRASGHRLYGLRREAFIEVCLLPGDVGDLRNGDPVSRLGRAVEGVERGTFREDLALVRCVSKIGSDATAEKAVTAHDRTHGRRRDAHSARRDFGAAPLAPPLGE